MIFVRKTLKYAILTNTSRYLKNSIKTLRTVITGMDLCEVVERLESYAPLSLAESWDNVGLLVEPSSTEHLIDTIILANDLTESVIDEAIHKKANLIFSYHPPIFAPLKTLTRKSWKERVILKAIENKIAIYSPHTAFDAVKGGVNDWLARGLGKGEVSPLQNALVHDNLRTHKVNVVISKHHGQSVIDELVTNLTQKLNNVDVNVRENM